MLADTQNKPEAEVCVYRAEPPAEEEALLRDKGKPATAFAQQISEQLAPMDVTLEDCSLSYLAGVYWSCAWPALKLLPNIASIPLTSMLMYMLLTHTKQPEPAAAFGMYISFYFVFCSPVQASLMEKFGQEVARGIGKNDQEYVKKVVSQGTLAFFMFFLGYTVPTLWFSDKILALIGFDPRLIPAVSSVLRPQIFVLLVQLPADMLNAFCMAQGLESETSRIGLFGFLASLFTQAFLVLYLHQGIEAYLFGSLALATCSLGNALLVLPKCKPETLGFASLATAFNGLSGYLSDSFYFFLAIFGECCSFNITVFFIAARHDTAAVGAYTAMRSCGSILYRMGQSLSAVSRARINILIGMGKHQTAKNFYTFYALGNLCLAAVFSLVFLVTRGYVASVIAGQSEDNKVKFIRTVFFYCCFCCLAEVSLVPCLLGLRALGKSQYLILSCIGVVVLVHIPCSYLVNRYNVETVWLVAVLGGSHFLITGLAFLISKLSDWSLIKVDR